MSLSTNHSKLDVYHLNCFKLTAVRREELRLFLNQHKPDVVSLNEIKLNEFEVNYYLNFENYITLYKLRNKNPHCGGEVVLLVKETLNPTNLSIFDEFVTDEVICAHIMVENKKTFVISYYVPPNCIPNVELFNKIDQNGYEFIICGDLNSSHKCFGSKRNNNNGEILVNIINQTGGVVIFNGFPTYNKFSSEYKEVLDLFIVSPFFFC